MINVLHLDGGAGWGGGQNQVRQLMRQLARRGVAQACICPQDSPLARRLTHEQLPVRPVGWRGALDPRAGLAIARAARSATILHAHDAHALQLAIPVSLRRRLPLVAARRVDFRASRLTWNRADRIVAVSEHVRHALTRDGVDADRIRVIVSGIDVEEVRSLPPLHPPLRQLCDLPASSFLAVTVGVLDRIKDQQTAIRAVALAANIHLALIGTGRDRERLARLADELGVGARVHFTGELDDARRALPEADVVVSTSLREGLGTTLLDAMALDIPVVAAAVGGPAEVLTPVHAASGCSLFEAGDASALAARLEAVRSGEAWQRMVTAQRVRLHAFDADTVAERHVALYRELLANP